MEKFSIDYKYSLDLLKKINEISYNGKPIKNSFFYKEYNLWQMYQQMILEDIKSFSREKKFTETSRNVIQIIKDTLLKSLMVLISLMSIFIFIISRRKVAIYSVDVVSGDKGNDQRLEALYKDLHKQHIPYTEIIHTFIGRKMLKNIIKRGRIPIYLEALDQICGFWIRSIKSEFFNKEDINFAKNEDEKKFVKSILARYILHAQKAKYKLNFLKFVFSFSAVKILFAIDDGRFYLEAVLAAKLVGIKTVAIQHGHFSKYHVGWVNMEGRFGKAPSSDQLILWSSYWRDELIRLNTYFNPDQLIIGGFPKKNTNESPRGNKKREGNITVLIPYETGAPKNEMNKLISKLLFCSGVKVLFKPRGDRLMGEQLQQYGIADFKKDSLAIEMDSKKALNKADIMLGTYSTFLYDGISGGLPTGILLSLSDHGEGAVSQGIAEEFKIDEDICAQVQKLAITSGDVLKERKLKLLGKDQKILEDTIRNILADNGIVEK